MAVSTPCIGAYPKPDYGPVSDWFRVPRDAQDYDVRVTAGDTWTLLRDRRVAETSR